MIDLSLFRHVSIFGLQDQGVPCHVWAKDIVWKRAVRGVGMNRLPADPLGDVNVTIIHTPKWLQTVMVVGLVVLTSAVVWSSLFLGVKIDAASRRIEGLSVQVRLTGTSSK